MLNYQRVKYRKNGNVKGYCQYPTTLGNYHVSVWIEPVRMVWHGKRIFFYILRLRHDRHAHISTVTNVTTPASPFPVRWRTEPPKLRGCSTLWPITSWNHWEARPPKMLVAGCGNSHLTCAALPESQQQKCWDLSWDAMYVYIYTVYIYIHIYTYIYIYIHWGFKQL